jgi:SAM-dependent methyltransferase
VSDDEHETWRDGAEAYEALVVPALLADWPPVLLAAAGVRPGDSVLDVGCGTGLATRAAAARALPGGFVAGLDPDPGMLALARRRARGVAWFRGRAESLPCADGSFDVVLSQFALMFCADRERAAGELLRVLAPGGRLALAVWDALESTPVYATELEVLGRVGGEAAADALRAPFVLGDPAALASLFSRAGAGEVSVARHVGSARFPSVRAFVEMDVKGWLPVMGVTLAPALADRVLREAEQALAPYADADGALRFASPALVLSASVTGACRSFPPPGSGGGKGWGA